MPAPFKAHDASRADVAPQPGVGAARAHPNIALVKYWGKRDVAGNLPSTGSVSMTVDTLVTQTEVRFVSGQRVDDFTLNGARASAEQVARLTAFVDRIRARAGTTCRVRVTSRNNFPTGAGLASSASGFAALAVAASAAAGLHLDDAALSVLARQGSGSAARSIYGGFVALDPGTAADGHDCVARPLFAPAHWPLRLVIAVTSSTPKAVGSTAGMERSRHTSPYYAAWLESHAADMQAARASIAARDFAALARVAEHSCMKMHALALGARPPLLYWLPATLAAVRVILAMAADGVAVTYTIDAGAQVKAICLPEAAARVQARLLQVPGVQQVLHIGVGGGAEAVPTCVRKST